MININRNKIIVNQNDTCIIELSLCNYKLKENDIIEFNFNGEITKQKYNETDLEFNTKNKGKFNYSVSILQEGIIRTEIIKNICEVI